MSRNNTLAERCGLVVLLIIIAGIAAWSLLKPSPEPVAVVLKTDTLVVSKPDTVELATPKAKKAKKEKKSRKSKSRKSPPKDRTYRDEPVG